MKKLRNIRYQLMRAKSSDYKNGGIPSLIKVIVKNKDGIKEEKSIQEMEIIDKDYPLVMPIILYNENSERQVASSSPFLVHNKELYAIYNFTQLEENKENEIVVNIWVLYVSKAKNSQTCKV